MKLKYVLFINDVLIDKFYRFRDVDDFLESFNGYIGKIEVKKI